MLSDQERATMERGIDALAASDMDALVAEYHPEVEFFMPPTASAEPATHHGREAARKMLDETVEMLGGLAAEVDEIVEGEGRVLCLAHFTAVGSASGVPLRAKGAWIWEFRDGQISRVEFYVDWDEAREAAGLVG
ncbi:MAG: nuclear transport factor 2 family protein [Solirubrobacterales bacterium]